MTALNIWRYPRGFDFLSFDKLPSGINVEPVPLIAEDGGRSRALFYSKGNEKTAVCVMHPRADMTRHYAVPGIVGNGYAFFAQICRSPGDDVSATTIHEQLLADVAAAIKFLRDRRFENVVMIGNSGAASLFALYHKQATTKPPGRLTTTAAGDTFDLNKLDMPTADGFMFLGPHLGAGLWLEESLDPSVVDEGDPLSYDPEFDIYNPANGFREFPAIGEFSDEFVKKYKAAQSARSARIDEMAWALIRDQHARDELAAGVAGEGPGSLLAKRQAAAGAGRRLQLYRLDANLLSIDRTTREEGRGYGSIFSLRPDITNYTMLASKQVDPRAWLSSWSTRYSRARLLDNLPALTLPTLVLGYIGDNTVHPNTVKTVFEQSPATQKEFALVPGDHFGFVEKREASTGGRSGAVTVMVDWLRAHFPIAA